MHVCTSGHTVQEVKTQCAGRAVECHGHEIKATLTYVDGPVDCRDETGSPEETKGLRIRHSLSASSV